MIKRGQGTEGNVASTTRGNDVTASGEGTVRNRGLILSPLGDITLAARQVEQAGVATTSVDARGTIHLNGVGADGAVTLRSARPPPSWWTWTAPPRWTASATP